jgi:membrane protein YqaA with SNARE-associated domain
MVQIATREALNILQTYGYLAVFVLVGLESAGIPLPGETMLLVAAIYAGTTHQLAIDGVIAATAPGAILGDNLGYWAGREAAAPLWAFHAAGRGRVDATGLPDLTLRLVLSEQALKLSSGLHTDQRRGMLVAFF